MGLPILAMAGQLLKLSPALVGGGIAVTAAVHAFEARHNTKAAPKRKAPKMADTSTQTPSAAIDTKGRLLAAKLRIYKAHAAATGDQSNALLVLAAAQAVKEAEEYEALRMAEVNRCRTLEKKARDGSNEARNRLITIKSQRTSLDAAMRAAHAQYLTAVTEEASALSALHVAKPEEAGADVELAACMAETWAAAAAR